MQEDSLFQCTHHLHCALLNAILLDDFPVMQHVELFSGILAGVQHDCLLATWMVGKESCHVQNFVTNDHPAVLVGVVLGDFVRGVSHDGNKAERETNNSTLKCLKCLQKTHG